MRRLEHMDETGAFYTEYICSACAQSWRVYQIARRTDKEPAEVVAGLTIMDGWLCGRCVTDALMWALKQANVEQ